MSNVKISALPAATTPLTGTELVPLVQSGVTSQVAVSNIKTDPAGSNTQVQFNNSGTFGASANFTWNGSTLALTGAVSATTTGKVGTTLGVGAATPSASGAGITFPATQSASTDANTLDDYEEGTWTPSLGGTATYNGQTGTYTKIGNVVTLLGNISVNIIGTGSTTLISGLPFNAASTLFSNAGSVGYNASLAVTVASINAQISSSASQVNFGSRSITGSYTEITAIFQNSSRLEFTIVYRV